VAACIVRVESLPPETDADIAETLSDLPALEPPEPGSVIDGFRVEELLYKSRAYRLYRAIDTLTNGAVALKIPNPKLARDKAFADSFLREEWIGKRVNSAHLVRMLPLHGGRRTALYSVLAFHEGENLAERIRRKRGLSVKETIYLGKQLLQALDDLHRHGVIHRDVRPKNILYDRANRHLMLLGLGAARVGPLELTQNAPATTAPSNLSFLAPECFGGQPLDERADIYAAGVTMYHMLTRRYPYGKIAARESPPTGPFLPPSHFDMDVPAWLEEALSRACAIDPGERYPNARAFGEALAEGSPARHREAGVTLPSRAAPVHARHLPWLIVGAAVLALLLYLSFILAR
jgi:serine/threonine protein kinase